MCGIHGLVKSIQAASRTLDEFIPFGLDAIAPRGPDGHATIHSQYDDFQVVFAHSRLSIIDVSDHGRQPMEDESSDWCITYNGEIYNYLEIREELRKLGWMFRGESDTEVLLKAWSQWGLDSLHRLNGMFAFAVFNRKTGQLWLVRDRFGVKPLLWGRAYDGSLGFSSSVTAVARLLDAEVDLGYCARGLRYKAFEVPGSEAPFEGVHAVTPGGWLKVQVSSTGLEVSDGRWYDLKGGVARTKLQIEACSDEDLLQRCEELVADAVRLRLRSDVPLAVSLSGGLDSSTVASIASRHVPNLNGFTYGSPTAARSEGPVVADFSKIVGIKARYIWPEHSAADLDALLGRVLASQEAPFPGLSVLAQNEVFRAVREAGFKVLLGGQGGDEAFAGYRKFFLVAARDALNQRDVVNTLRLISSLGLMLLHEAGQARTYWHALGRYRNRSAFEFDLLDWAPPTENLWGEANYTLADRQIDDIQKWSIPSLLRYEDRNSMGHGVESRLPFMDYRLVELALALPARLKISNGFGKWALRHVTDKVVPDTVRLNRKKRGFDVTQTWIEGGIGASLRARIRDHQGKLSPYLKKNMDHNALLSDHALKTNPNLLDEALMLAWLAEPRRVRGQNGIEA